VSTSHCVSHLQRCNPTHPLPFSRHFHPLPASTSTSDSRSFLGLIRHLHRRRTERGGWGAGTCRWLPSSRSSSGKVRDQGLGTLAQSTDDGPICYPSLSAARLTLQFDFLRRSRPVAAGGQVHRGRPRRRRPRHQE
jgi:hypothetical protein